MIHPALGWTTTPVKVLHPRCSIATCDTEGAYSHIKDNTTNLPQELDSAALPLPKLSRRVTVEEIDDEYWSWHAMQDWLPDSDPAILRPVAEFCGGEGDGLHLNSMSASAEATQGTTSFPTHEPSNPRETTEVIPNRNTRRRHSQEL